MVDGTCVRRCIILFNKYNTSFSLIKFIYITWDVESLMESMLKKLKFDYDSKINVILLSIGAPV